MKTCKGSPLHIFPISATKQDEGLQVDCMAPGDAGGEDPHQQAGQGGASPAAGGCSSERVTDGPVALHRDGQYGEHGGVSDGKLYVGHHLT